VMESRGIEPVQRPVIMSAQSEAEPSVEEMRRWQVQFARAGWLLAALTVGVLGWQLAGQLLDARASPAWPTAAGVVVSSDIVPRAIGPKTTAHAEVLYRYEVDGVAYAGDRVTFAPDMPMGWLAKRWAVAYSGGTEVAVRYDPRDPSNSVLEPGLSLRGAVLAVLAGAGFIVFGLGAALVCFALSRHWRRRADEAGRNGDGASLTRPASV
jgi:hypothetical protein